MAATNYTPIQLYFSTTASAVPLAANLAQGELAINITDGKLYYEDNGGVVQVIATKGAGTIGGSTTQIQYNNAGALAGNAAMTFNSGTSTTTLTTLNLTNALGAIYGGTAQSAYTQGDFLYASATNTLSKLGIGTVNYILTSTGSIPQWSAPSSIIVQTATNLAGGLAGSVPYQSALDTTTFLAIGAANRVMTSTGSAPQWVTALTGLTSVSSSSINNTSLTSGRVVYSGAVGIQTDSANLTFDGTTLSAAGLSTTGFTTMVKTITAGNSSFNGTAVFAPTTPAKLFIGTGTVTDVTSSVSATNAAGAIMAMGITPIAATNASVTYTNASTLYIAGAPSASTNITITNPYALYVAAGASYFGGAVTVAGTISLAGVTVTSLTDSGLTSGRVTYATTAGLLTDSANLLYSGTDLTVYGVRVGRGSGAVATNTVVGTTAGNTNSSGNLNTYVGYETGFTNSIGTANTGMGVASLYLNTGSNNTAYGRSALENNTTASNNTAVGYQAGYNNTTGAQNTFMGFTSGFYQTTGAQNTAIGVQSFQGSSTTVNNTGVYNSALGYNSLQANSSGNYNTAVGSQALQSNTTASSNTAVGYQAGYTNQAGSFNTYIGYQSGYTSNPASGSSVNTAVGTFSGFSLTTGTINSFLGYNAGYYVTSGSKNVIIGGYTGQAAPIAAIGSNYVVLSDGDGNIRLVGKPTGDLEVTVGAAGASTGVYPGIYASYGAGLSGMGGEASLVNNLYYTGGYKFLATSGGTGGAVTIGSTGSFRVIAATNSASAGGAATTVDTLNVSVNTNLVLQGGTGSAGTGIGFPATQYASSNANTLDDYEEGTWTPVLTDGTNNAGGYFYQFGSYIKVGRLVTVNCTISVSTVAPLGAGAVWVTGLPFTSGIFYNVNEQNILSAKVFPLGVNNYVVGTIDTSSTRITPLGVVAGGQNNILGSNVSVGSQLFFTGTYWAAS